VGKEGERGDGPPLYEKKKRRCGAEADRIIYTYPSGRRKGEGEERWDNSSSVARGRKAVISDILMPVAWMGVARRMKECVVIEVRDK